MYQYRIRIQNRILQKLYKPRRGKSRFITTQALSALEEIDRHIQEKITPLLSELFD
ncbi:MAG: hypothetical protein FWC92_11350 [Defluviitaleaceae bacterium]|nr:hypothetical protein [Defluviitaleaceae bacterium]